MVRPFVVGGRTDSVRLMAGTPHAEPDGGAQDEFPPAGRQVIPRPAQAYAGAPAPWASLSPARRRGIGLARVRAAVEARHRALEGAERVTFDGFPDPGAPSGVLVALFEEAG